MSREVKRVPLGFDWPINKPWWGFNLGEVPCQTCAGSGWVLWCPYPHKDDARIFKRKDVDGWFCPHCEGDGVAYCPHIEPPTGIGHQVWCDGGGCPVTPVFETFGEAWDWYLAQ